MYKKQFAHFQKIQIDGKDIEEANYDIEEGSAIVTLKVSYLETLSEGDHTIAVISDTGTATAEFMIKAADTQPPQTGDSSDILLWGALLLASGGVLCTMAIRKKKQLN